jgi:hypothetical protein
MPKVMSFARIDEAIAQLDHPNAVWFRGHSASHQLLPWLFRFSGALENEVTIAKRFQRLPDKRNSPSSGLQALIAMHHAYLPARLLAWTENLEIALFCAFAREAASPTIFVLNPIELNRLSNITGILRVEDRSQRPIYFSDWPSDPSLPQSPIAVDGRLEFREAGLDTIFTVHGTDPRPIEEQCPRCVRKVVLTEKEKLAAVRRIVFGE